ncbi:MAG: hypothetical protein LH606_02830 [Cytophagaceae bacterium]|nr:hypothetical protein [Cytophagaceae bacterium]
MNPIKNPILAGIFALTTSATFAQAPIFQAVVIRHSVADFDKWKPGFDADSTGQKAAGMTNIVVSRGIENPNDVESVFMLADVPKAKRS